MPTLFASCRNTAFTLAASVKSPYIPPPTLVSTFVTSWGHFICLSLFPLAPGYQYKVLIAKDSVGHEMPDTQIRTPHLVYTLPVTFNVILSG